ncbi:hypothetical protein JW998_14190 [candidate division KSB1 bacterium]|nr:hypothetical protein [candidate division KSB1 bacterium]
MNRSSENRMTNPVKGNPRGALISAAVAIGLVVGLGGALLLSHSLIRRPLQKQQEKIGKELLAHRQEVAQLDQRLAEGQEQLKAVQEKIHYLIVADSSGYLKELTSIQKENRDRERLYVQQLQRLEQQMNLIENANELLSKNFAQARGELERDDRAMREDLRALQSSVADLKNKIQQLERQFASQ